MNHYPRVYLKPGREAAIERRHPWVFSGSIARVEGTPTSGALVALHGAEGAFLAWGHYSAASQIRLRLLSWSAAEDPDAPEFWRARLLRAIAGRAPLLADRRTTACRLVNAESDGLPGLIVDRYGDAVVLQALAAGIDARRELLRDLLVELLHPQTLYERSDVDIRQHENLTSKVGLLYGVEPPERVQISEIGLQFLVDVRRGHKTGFYLDQRDNRRLLGERIAALVQTGRHPDLLNVFAYTGGFTLYALAYGGKAMGGVTNIDVSTDVLEQSRANLRLNGFETERVTNISGDAFQVLRTLRQQGRSFDVIVLDPPKFAFTQKDIQKAARGYKDINLQALHMLRAGGYLFTFSCSGAISADLLQKIVFGAALDAEREVQITGWMTQAEDHPVALTFPEGSYLKGLICHVTA